MCEKEDEDRIINSMDERWIRVITCRNCPYISDKRLLVDVYCKKYLHLYINNLDVIHPQCQLDKEPTRRKADLNG